MYEERQWPCLSIMSAQKFCSSMDVTAEKRIDLAAQLNKDPGRKDFAAKRWNLDNIPHHDRR